MAKLDLRPPSGVAPGRSTERHVKDLRPAHRDLLGTLNSSTPSTLDEILARVGGKRSSVHRWLTHLVKQQYVRHLDQGGYTLDGKGQAYLRGVKSRSHDPRPRLPLPLEVRELPELHQALIELILCAAAMRYHRIASSHLAAFLLFGATQRLKTSVARIACLLAGGDLTKHILTMFMESAASSSVRRNAKGTARVREAASAPVVCLDEYSKTEGDVRRACQMYIFGESTFAGEESPVEVLATAVLTLNPPDREETVDQTPKPLPLRVATGFDGSFRRRLVMADMTRVEIPDKLKGKRVRQIEEAVKKAGPHRLPRPMFPDHVPDELVATILKRIFDKPSRLGEVNILLVAQLVAGATAYIHDKGEALRNVVWNLAVCYATLGWLRHDWREILVAEFGHDAEEDRAPEPRPQDRDEDEEEPHDPTHDETVAGLRRVRILAEELGITWDEAMRRLAQPIRPAQQPPATPDAQAADELWAAARQLGFKTADQAGVALTLGAEGSAWGVRPGDLELIARAIAQELDPESTVDEAIFGLLALLGEHGTIESAIDAARERREREASLWASKVAKVRSAVRAQELLLRDGKLMLDGIRRAIAEKRTDPNAGPIVRELEALGENAFFRRLRARTRGASPVGSD